jgi:hypothetical protein
MIQVTTPPAPGEVETLVGQAVTDPSAAFSSVLETGMPATSKPEGFGTC